MLMLENLLYNRIIVFYQTQEFFDAVWEFIIKIFHSYGMKCTCRRSKTVSTISTNGMVTVTFVKPNDNNARALAATQVFLEPCIPKDVVKLLAFPALARTGCGNNCYVIKIKDHEIYKRFYAEKADTFYMKNETPHQISFDEYMETL